MKRWVVGMLLTAIVGAPLSARADAWGDDYLLFTKESALWQSSPSGKGASKVVDLPEGKLAESVTEMSTDPQGKVLLAQIDSKWYWYSLRDGDTGVADKSWRALACASGSGATIAPDGNCVLCANEKKQAKIIRLKDGVSTVRAVPADHARLAVIGKDLMLIWEGDNGIWRAPVNAPKKKEKVAPQAPLSSLSISPDGLRAFGTFPGESKHGKRVDVEPQLFGFALDGIAARRKGIKHGAPLQWSHDSAWVLTQDRDSGCLMQAVGGQYKCWKNQFAVGISPTGRWALLIGVKAAGDETVQKKPAKNSQGKKKKKKSKRSAFIVSNRDLFAAPQDKEMPDPNSSESSIAPDEDGDEPDQDLNDPVDVSSGAIAPIARPTGPRNLYRADVNGAFTDPPALVFSDFTGAVVWVSKGKL